MPNLNRVNLSSDHKVKVEKNSNTINQFQSINDSFIKDILMREFGLDPDNASIVLIYIIKKVLSRIPLNLDDKDYLMEKWGIKFSGKRLKSKRYVADTSDMEQYLIEILLEVEI